MSIELKIKQKYLALEPGIIRSEERKLKSQIKWLKKNSLEGTDALSWKLNSLQSHRRREVCNESRATLLARTYLAGKPYSHAEKKRKADREDSFQRLVVPRIVAMVKKYGKGDQLLVDNTSISKWSAISLPV